MDSIFKNYVGIILTFLGFYILASIGFVQMQVTGARRLHTAVVSQVQSSYYAVDIDAINDKIHESYPNWQVTSTVVNSVNNRQDRLITLNYNIVLPLFGIETTGQIDGYAR